MVQGVKIHRVSCKRSDLCLILFRIDVLTVYQPKKNQSIDEGMIAYIGRFSAKQYIPHRKVKWGIKVWMRSDKSLIKGLVF
jgi:hypothetical protein